MTSSDDATFDPRLSQTFTKFAHVCAIFCFSRVNKSVCLSSFKTKTKQKKLTENNASNNETLLVNYTKYLESFVLGDYFTICENTICDLHFQVAHYRINTQYLG